MGQFEWVAFYKEFAKALLGYKDRRGDIINNIIAVYKNAGINLPTLERDNQLVDIDPFTVFGLFNKSSLKDSNRIKIISGLAEAFGVDMAVPTVFDSVPTLNNQNATFYYFIGDRGEEDIDNLWELFDAALKYAIEPSTENRAVVTKYFNIVINKKGNGNSKITMGLYWIAPDVFLNLDSRNEWYIYSSGKIPADIVETLPKVEAKISAKKYFDIVEALTQYLKSEKSPLKDFKELSFEAWRYSTEVNEENKKAAELQSEHKDDAIVNNEVKNVRYWLYSPGEKAFNWERDVRTGTMALGWDFLGDFTQYNDEELLAKFQERYNDTSSHKNDKCAIWDFVNKMKIGDVIIAKRGTDKIIGKGIVQSDYYYDESLDKYKNLREVEWTDVGEWEHRPGKAVVKTLTDITMYEGYPEGLCAIIDGTSESISVEEIIVENYTKEDFLNDVYISEEKYDTCVSRLKHKKNLILQGAPGVGKTFAARRLAWSIMGVKDDNRIEFVQFHQSYSYEDFIMGYKPAGDGFALEKGLFYNFCLKAKNDPTNDYFFIIDEINRGNMSKIFGELLMLVENDYRGTDITLAYDKKPFSVPINLYIIGMMNTADRSLAMIDYALRRRFSFVEMVPGFDSEGFEAYQTTINNNTFNKLIGRVKALNADIENDASLGKGFCIGHSYFCGLEDGCTDAVLKEIVDYDIIPMLEEYWFDDEAKAKNWSNDLSGVFNG